MTFSLVACDLEAGQWGVGVASKTVGVGQILWAEPHVGAVATQAFFNPQYGPRGLALLRAGRSAQEVIEQLTADDEGRDGRQLGVVDAQGRSASFTGERCLEWSGGRSERCYAAQGNILLSAETVAALAETFEASAGKPLAERLLDSLVVAEAAGGDRRGRQAAALLVVEAEGGYAKLSDVVVDLRVDDHENPVLELRRLYGLLQSNVSRTPKDAWIDVDEALASELAERLARLGHESGLTDALGAWATVTGLAARVEGAERIDPVVLERLRASR